MFNPKTFQLFDTFDWQVPAPDFQPAVPTDPRLASRNGAQMVACWHCLLSWGHSW